MKISESIYIQYNVNHNNYNMTEPKFKFVATVITPKINYTVEEIAASLQADMVIFHEDAPFKDGKVKDVAVDWKQTKASLLKLIDDNGYVVEGEEKDEKGKKIPSDSETMHKKFLGALEDQERQFKQAYQKDVQTWLEASLVVFKAMYSIIDGGTPVAIPSFVDLSKEEKEGKTLYEAILKKANASKVIVSESSKKEVEELVGGFEVEAIGDVLEIEADLQKPFLEYMYSTDPADLLVNII